MGQNKKSNLKLDLVGEILLNWRIRTVLPFIEGRLLDVGCGTNKLVRKYGSGTGVDVHQFGGADMIFEDTSRTSFNNDSFDTITIIATLNHIPNRKDVLREMHRILKPGGRIIITMIPPFISRIWHIIRSPWDRDQTERGMIEGEVYGLTKKEVRYLLGSSKFILVKEGSFMIGMNRLYIAKKNT
jgi:SAM-dependent methyltransferase